MTTLTLTLADSAALQELYREHLSKGRAFVPGPSNVTERITCELVLELEGRSHRLVAEVVHVRDQDPGRGVGLQLARLDADATTALRSFVDFTATASTAETEAGDATTEEGDSARVQTLQDRIGSLSSMEQQKLAAAGTLAERVALERMYGPSVWETLLRNTRLTPPEVARIARKATLPRPLVELIAANSSWLGSGEVQRALLSNPRSSPAVVAKVLRVMPRADLQLVPQQTAYPVAVRQTAKGMLGKG